MEFLPTPDISPCLGVGRLGNSGGRLDSYAHRSGLGYYLTRLLTLCVYIDPKFIPADFDRLHPAVDSVGVPVIDLRDTFLSANLDDLRVDPLGDIHPNARGYEMIFENLYAKLRAQSEAWAALVGNATASPDRAKVSSRGKSFQESVHGSGTH